MARKLLPRKWSTARLRLADSTVEDVPALQQINDLVPQTQGWMENADCSMLVALQEGVLPPVAEKSREYFRMQSIQTMDSDQWIGFIGVYHGFPEEDIFWINTITFHPEQQGKGYGQELMRGLIEQARQTGSYTRMRTYVSLTNLASLKMCVRVGFNTMLEIAVREPGDTDAHVLLEKLLTERRGKGRVSRLK